MGRSQIVQQHITPKAVMSFLLLLSTFGSQSYHCVEAFVPSPGLATQGKFRNVCNTNSNAGRSSLNRVHLHYQTHDREEDEGYSSQRSGFRSRFSNSIFHNLKSGEKRSSTLRKSTSSKSRNLSIRQLRPLKTRLYAKKDDEENKEEKDVIDTIKSKLSTMLPPKLLEVLNVLVTRFINFFPTLKVATASFIAGAGIAITAILVPVYTSVDKMTEPVTLFETILSDLDRGYVDDVDTKKLFETGVSAMLRSLDPYTEFEGKQEAQDLSESVSGKYGGIGLVISGATPVKNVAVPSDSVTEVNSNTGSDSKLLPKDAIDDNNRMINEDDMISSMDDDDDLLLDDVEEAVEVRKEQVRKLKKAREQGVRVVSAMEGYAFDYGMRPGDKLLAVDGTAITPDMSVEDVRNKLRGEPGSSVSITFQRDGVEGENTITMPRSLVRLRDVKLATLLGKPEDGIGYIQLSGFAANAGPEVRAAIFALQQASEDASKGAHSLQGLVLDLRGNPGGLLTSAVDVTSLFVPKGSEIVSARGRGFPGVLYRSRVDPILDPKTKLTVLVNGQTASAAEIVSGAIQDLDVGVIVGGDRTFGKGLVQNVEDLPFDTALKFTVAKYYTPSGRCIQSTNYKEGSNTRYQATKVSEKDKATFYTTNGREVKDGGGVAVDYKVEPPQASALEVTLLRSGVLGEFASEWSKTHQLTNNFDVDDATYRDFQEFVMRKEKEGDVKLDALYRAPMDQLKKSLKLSGFTGSSKELDQLQSTILVDLKKDFVKYKKDIKEDITTTILSRYLPESMLIERGLKSDEQVIAAVKLMKSDSNFDSLLARNSDNTSILAKTGSLNTARGDEENRMPLRINVKW